MYDPLDVVVLVTKLADTVVAPASKSIQVPTRVILKFKFKRVGSSRGLGEVGKIDTILCYILAALMSKYSETMKSVPALRGAAQMIDLAIEAL